MDTGTSQFKHTLIYGSITGLIISAYLLMLFFFSMMNNNTLVNISGLFFVGGAFISVKRYRDVVMGGILNFGKAYGTALLTFIFTGVVWAIYSYILYKYLSPGLLEEKITQSQESLLQLGWTEDKVEAYTELISKSQTPFTFALGYIFNSAFWGAILALIVAVFMRRGENPLLKNNP
jgi:hypothetical protein